MNLKAKIERLEKSLDPNVCHICGTPLPSVAEAGAKIEALLPEYEQAGCTREQALHLLREDAPMLMRRMGFLPVIPEGHCSGCGTSLRPIAEEARRALAQLTNALGGDQEIALQELRELAPEFVAYLP